MANHNSFFKTERVYKETCMFTFLESGIIKRGNTIKTVQNSWLYERFLYFIKRYIFFFKLWNQLCPLHFGFCHVWSLISRWRILQKVQGLAHPSFTECRPSPSMLLKHIQSLPPSLSVLNVLSCLGSETISVETISSYQETLPFHAMLIIISPLTLSYFFR